MNVTKNTVRNVKWGLIYQGLLLFFPFIIRTIVIRFLGEDYLGLSSLFTSILNLMSVAELGFSSAIIYCMYEPIATSNQVEIRCLLAFYRKIYQTIGSIVATLGIAVTPFLPYFIKSEYPADVNIYVLYFIYLLNTVLGYFLFSYKTALLTAYQRSDVINKNTLIANILQYCLQILVLFLFRDYHLYLIILPITTIATNLFNHFSSKKLFPECYCEGEISEKERTSIKKQVKGILVSKICNMLRNSLANIIISSFIGLTILAMYSNYYFIMTAVHGILTVVGVSMKAGVGLNLVKETKENNYKTFKRLTFMYLWVAGWFACCMLSLFQPFMLFWTGKTELVFENYIMILFPIYFFVLCLQDMRNVFTDAAGLHWEIRYRALWESIAYVLLSFVLGYFYGVFGILLSMIITYIFINLTYGTQILFRHYFTEQSCFGYWALQIKYTAVTVLAAAACYFLCEKLPFDGIANLFMRAIVCVVLPNAIFLVCYSRDEQFVDAKRFVLHRVLKK